MSCMKQVILNPFIYFSVGKPSVHSNAHTGEELVGAPSLSTLRERGRERGVVGEGGDSDCLTE